MTRAVKMGKGSEGVRSVERAIELLQALNRNPLSTVGELHRATGIPKSSVVRLLRALEAEGLVAQTASYSAYRLLGQVTSLSSGFPQELPVVERAEPIMIEFTKQEGWPVELAVLDRDAVAVRASTIPYTSLASIQSAIDLRLSLVGHALGQVYLAHLPATEQKALLAVVRESDSPYDAAARDLREVRQMLKTVRERGYAIRNQTLHTQTSTIAVPVFEKGRLAAGLGLTWLAGAMPLQRALTQYVPRLQGLSAAISCALDGKAVPIEPDPAADEADPDRYEIAGPSGR